MKIENVFFVLFNLPAALKVVAKRVDLAIRHQDDFTSGMSLFRTAVYFGFINDPWPNSAHTSSGELHPQKGQVSTPQE